MHVHCTSHFHVRVNPVYACAAVFEKGLYLLGLGGESSRLGACTGSFTLSLKAGRGQSGEPQGLGWRGRARGMLSI